MRTYTFFGADNKTGVTMTARSVAEVIAEKHIKKKVIFLHLDGNYSVENHRCKIGLDDLKAALFSEVLNASEFENGKNKRHANLYEIAGITDYVSAGEYMPEHVKKLLDILAQAQFDICIIDVGSTFSAGLTIGGLLYSDVNCLVTTQQQPILMRFLAIRNQILSKLDIKFDCVIVNKYISNKNLCNLKELMNNYNMDTCFAILMSDYGLQAENEGESLLDYKDKQYRECVEKFAEILASGEVENLE